MNKIRATGAPRQRTVSSHKQRDGGEQLGEVGRGGGGGEHPEELSVVADHFKQNGGNEMISGFKLELRRSTLGTTPAAGPPPGRHLFALMVECAEVLHTGPSRASLAAVDLMRLDVCRQRRETECTLACT